MCRELARYLRLRGKFGRGEIPRRKRDLVSQYGERAKGKLSVPGGPRAVRRQAIRCEYGLLPSAARQLSSRLPSRWYRESVVCCFNVDESNVSIIQGGLRVQPYFGAA